MKAGFPDRLPFALALGTYSCVKVALPPAQRLAPTAIAPIADLTAEVNASRDQCALMMAANGIAPDRWVCGRTALCLKVGVLPELDHLRNLALVRAATKLEAMGRGMLGRREYADRVAAREVARAEAAAAAAAAAEAEALAAAKAAEEAEAAAAAEASPGGLLSARRKKKSSARGANPLQLTPPPPGMSNRGGALSSARALLSFRGTKGTPATGKPAAAPSTPAPAPADPNVLQMGERVWHVSSGGHVRHVMVVGIAQSDPTTPAATSAAAFAAVCGTADVRYSVQYVKGAAAPFVAHAYRLFRTPPSSAQLATLQVQPRDSSAAGSLSPEVTVEAEKAERMARSRARRLEKLRQLHEQAAKNWSLWHPQCRPSNAPVIAVAPSGFEEVPTEVLEYAHYLGMSFPEDASFLWIAEQVRPPRLLIAFSSPSHRPLSRFFTAFSCLLIAPSHRPFSSPLLRASPPSCRARGACGATQTSSSTSLTPTRPSPRASIPRTRTFVPCTMRTSSLRRMLKAAARRAAARTSRR